MKKYLFLLVFVLSTANAEYIKWYYNYDKGHQEAVKQHKSIMLFLKDDNAESVKMFEETFSNRDIIKIVNKNYISIQLPYGTDQFPLELYYTLEPASLFFATEYEILFGEKFTGHVNSAKLLKVLKQYQELE